MILNLSGSEIVRGLSLTVLAFIWVARRPGRSLGTRGREMTAPAPTLLRQLTATSAIDCRQVHLPRNTEFTFAIWNQGWSDIGKRHAYKSAESCFYIKETFIKRDFFIQNKYWNFCPLEKNSFICILSFSHALTNSQNEFEQAYLTLQRNTLDQKGDSWHDRGQDDMKVWAILTLKLYALQCKTLEKLLLM